MKLITSLADIAVLVGIVGVAIFLLRKIFAGKLARRIIRNDVPLSVLDVLYRNSTLYLSPWNIRQKLDEDQLHMKLSQGGIESVLNLLMAHGLCHKKQALDKSILYGVNIAPAKLLLAHPRPIPQQKRAKPESTSSPPGPSKSAILPPDECGNAIVLALFRRPCSSALTAGMTFEQLLDKTRLSEVHLRDEIQRLVKKRVLARSVVLDDGKVSEGYQLVSEDPRTPRSLN